MIDRRQLPSLARAAVPFWSPFVALLHSRKFLVALFAVIQTIVFVLRPDVNQDVWKAIDALAAVLIASIAHEDAAVSTRSESWAAAPHAGLPRSEAGWASADGTADVPDAFGQVNR